MNKAKPLQLDYGHKKSLKNIANSDKAPKSVKRRARILLYKSDGLPNIEIARMLGVNRHTVELWVNKYKNRNKKESIDKFVNVSMGRGKTGKLTEEEKIWVINAWESINGRSWLNGRLKTKDLQNYIMRHAKGAGHEHLETASTIEIYRIVKKHSEKKWSKVCIDDAGS